MHTAVTQRPALDCSVCFDQFQSCTAAKTDMTRALEALFWFKNSPSLCKFAVLTMTAQEEAPRRKSRLFEFEVAI